MDRGCVIASEKLYRSFEGLREAEYFALRIGSALRRLLLEDGNAVCALARLAREDVPSLSVRLMAATALLLHLGDVSRAFKALEVQEGAGLPIPSRSGEGAHPVLLAFWTHAGHAGEVLGRVLEELGRDDPRLDALGLACALQVASPQRDGPLVRKAVKKCLKALCRDREAQEVGLCAALLVRSAQAAGIADMPVPAGACHDVDIRLRGQRTIYRLDLRVKEQARLHNPSHVSMSEAGRFSAPRAIPRLSIRLFGRFEVYQGESMAPVACTSRRKARLLLAILAVECGHDVSCEQLAFALWPESSGERSMHNFNNVVSLLRSGIALPDGECPYLTRTRGLIRLRSDLVGSDYAEIMDLCRGISRERHPIDSMLSMLDRLSCLYAGEFMPGSYDVEPLVLARRNCRTRVVDAALRSAQRLASMGEVQGALPFAEKALAWDVDREDCYETLMVAQARCGQRPAAIETWKRYCRHMRELGMDASQRMQRVYLLIIDGFDFAGGLDEAVAV